MIECVFTIDYEVYGNGQGQLDDLVYKPTQKLKTVFDSAGAKFVNFVEVAEFCKMERHASDPAIADVLRQIRELHEQGHETALHLHPQWANARYHQGCWELDYSEYNLCVLPPDRIARIVDDALAWLRHVIGDDRFTPCSFRAGNWLFQPTGHAAAALAARGVKIDSSVFKGGLQRQHRLDYRPALRNGWHWEFDGDVNVPAVGGRMLELPIYTEMVPFWRMLTGKRVGLQQKTYGAGPSAPARTPKPPGRFSRLLDYCRPRYPLKFDFCRMTLSELIAMAESVMREDHRTPAVFKPMVSIGHTKDLVDFDTIAAFLNWLREHSIPVTTLSAACHRCQSPS